MAGKSSPEPLSAAELLAAAAIIAAQADRSGHTNWHKIAGRLTEASKTAPQPKQEADA